MGGRSSKPVVSPPEMEEVKPLVSQSIGRPHPQETFDQTVFDHDSFYGRLRSIYYATVLKTQLDQLRKQGSYDAFKLKWHPKYDINKLHNGTASIHGSPPTLFWDSDVGKWLEAACYFLLSPAAKASPHHAEFKRSVDELVEMIVKAQQPDGYIGTYFTVVDKPGRLKNLRDHHEMYCCGHLLEGALAHYKYSGSRHLLNAMIKYVELLLKMFGPGQDQRHGYPGHPELELALVRLYGVTRDPRHLAFAQYMVSARGRQEPDLGGKPYFVWEAEQRKDSLWKVGAMESLDDGRYHSSHVPLHEQVSLLGHSVRALYLLVAAADLGGQALEDARRLWTDCVDNKIYVTGGIGSVPAIEGFSEVPHLLPNSDDEGGCYAETCASIACMMLCERLLSHRLDIKVRDVLERCLLNNVLGGASLEGDRFYYDNKLNTSANDTSDRHDWFDVCCCPPNLTRTMGILGGYIWSSSLSGKDIQLNVHLYASASLKIPIPGGQSATVRMTSGMPWSGSTSLELDAPANWVWRINLPIPGYAADFALKTRGAVKDQRAEKILGYETIVLDDHARVDVAFDMPVGLLSPHPDTHQDTLTVARGPIIYAVESHDNEGINKTYPHFAGVGITESMQFDAVELDFKDVRMIGLVSKDNAFGLQSEGHPEIFSMRSSGEAPNDKVRSWRQINHKLKLVPFFARANRSTGQTLRTALARVSSSDIKVADSSADDQFRKIYEKEWTWRQGQHIEFDEDAQGVRADLPHVDEATQQARLAYWTDIRREIDDIEVSKLSPAERLNHRVYVAQLDVLIAGQSFKQYQRPLNSDSGFWSNQASQARESFTTAKDYLNYLTQLEQVPRYFAQNIDNMRAGVKRGFTPPKITLKGRDRAIAAVAEATTPTDTIYFEPFKTMPAVISPKEKTRLRSRGSELIQSCVMPAYRQLLAFFREEYYPHAATSLAAYDLPDGKAYYASRIKEFTTLDLTPSEIHDIGRNEVSRIREEMLQIIHDSGHKGDFASFQHFLRNDPQFYAKTAEEYLMHAAYTCKAFDGVSDRYFGRLPRKRFAIKPVPTDLAPYAPSGSGGPGVIWLNTYDLPSRALFALPALCLHEGAPGHAFQMPLVNEHDDLPSFRSVYISAYGEGWALYCESLGTEMGIYRNLYEQFGMLSYQVWRAARLVVDTGIHAKGWTRKQAQDYLAEYTALSTHEIETEVDRYIALPGQALAYYMGCMTLMKIRRKAETTLGDRFNIKAFHDAVLQTGSIPLPLLEAHIDDFISGGGIGPYPNEE